MKKDQIETFGKAIQWALNLQVDLLIAAERQWGFSSKASIWEDYKAILHRELPKRINFSIIDKNITSRLLKFLSDPHENYHLEMSFDELAHQFLNAIEKE